MGEVDDELARVRQQHADLEQLLEAGSWDYDVTSGTVEWSAGQCRLYGVDPITFEATYDAWFAMVHPDDREMISRTMAEAIELVDDYGFDHRFLRHGDGALRWTRCRGRVFAGPDGRTARVLGVSIDTTEEHATAERLAEFIANAAHELRTPAAAIGQAVQALGIAHDEATRAEVVAALTRQSARLRHLTTNLVHLATVDAGPSATLLEPVPLVTAIHHALAHASPPLGREVQVDVAPDLVVRADVHQLDRVFVNLLTNAFRYGGPNVTIRATAAGGRVEVEVADDGDGIPAAVGTALFEPFRRGPQRHPEASGLGLAIVERLMHRFGGSARYCPGEPGAVFVLTFDQP
jgi:signal transduction histidine kinase